MNVSYLQLSSQYAVAYPEIHFFGGGYKFNKIMPAVAYDISYKNVVMQIEHTHVINCTVARLQPRRIDIYLTKAVVGINRRQMYAVMPL